MLVNWSTIISAHGPTVWRTVYRIVNDPEAARDCYQETFLAALRLSRRQTIDNWQAMLRTIAAQTAIDHLRRARVRAVLPLAGGHADHIPDRAPADPASLPASELAEAVRQLLSGLPPRQAEAFWLRYVEQMDAGEVAIQLNTTAQNVSVLVSRASEKLRERLARTAFAPESWSSR